jgi:hypothetical protein
LVNLTEELLDMGDSNIKMDLRETLSGKGERGVHGPDSTGSERNKEPSQSPKTRMEFLEQLSKYQLINSVCHTVR